MPVDLWTLIDRDHTELERGLDKLVAFPDVGVVEEIRIGLVAHVEAEDALLRLLVAHVAGHVLAEIAAAHRVQEHHLVRLAASPFTEWSARAALLRDLIEQHHHYERTWCLPALRTRVPSDQRGRLVATYATERLRAITLTWPLASARV